MAIPDVTARALLDTPRAVAGAWLLGLACAAVALGRDDPRPPSDAPTEVEAPAGRRAARRAYRRNLRRRQTDDEGPLEFPSSMPRQPGEDDAAVVEPPRPFPSGMRQAGLLHRDQPYVRQGPCHPRQRFDLYLPEGCGGGTPLIVWIHGDTWRDGSKTDCPVAWLTGEGYAVASIGYRLSDTAVFPAQLEDCRAAIAAIVTDADLWGVDPGRIAVVGSGAGGHLAALVGLAGHPAAVPAEGVDAAAEEPVFRLAGICALSAPASLTTLGPDQDRPGSPASRLVGGPLPEFREVARQASPVAHVSSDDPPVLLVHGTRDASVPVRQAVELDRALSAVGVDGTLVMLEDCGHRLPLEPGTPAGQAVLRFLERVLGPGVRPASDAAP